MLEDWLQTELFDRVGRSVTLNPAGRAYAEAISPALAAIRVATRARHRAARRESRWSIATLPSFGMRWLAPRLGRLTRDMPELVINVAARVHEFDIDAEGFDAAIHFGAPTWHGVAHDPLFREQSVVVIAPGLLAERRITAPADLLGIPLLAQAERRGAWRQWFAAVGCRTKAPRPRGRCSSIS